VGSNKIRILNVTDRTDCATVEMQIS